MPLTRTVIAGLVVVAVACRGLPLRAESSSLRQTQIDLRQFGIAPRPATVGSDNADTDVFADEEPSILPLPLFPDEQGNVERLPPVVGQPVDGDFPPLPPDPYEDEREPLPPLEEELWLHGGAHLYEPEGDQRNRVDWSPPTLRLPEDYPTPQPLTAFQEFLGADPPHDRPKLHWPGHGGYVWEPRFVGAGAYQLFGFTTEADNRRQTAIGHQLLVDLDLRLTGTERFHVQFRPLGEKFTGGSYYQFTDPAGYVDNSTGVPDRYWFEGELQSIFGAYIDPFSALDYHFVAGSFPMALHNNLLMNDDILGFAVNKNTILHAPTSNINVQLFAGLDNVDVFDADNGQVYGVNAFVDYKLRFYEATYAFVNNDVDATRNAHYAALSGTHIRGPMTLTGRALFKWGDQGGRGDGQLFVLESNRTRCFDHQPLGIEKAIIYANAFHATAGWSPIAAGNFNRLTASFEVNPLVQIATGQNVGDIWGAALGMQLFRLNEDESLIPEIAVQSNDDMPVFGCGLRYFRKTGRRSYFEVLGVLNYCDDPRFERKGVFVSETILF